MLRRWGLEEHSSLIFSIAYRKTFSRSVLQPQRRLIPGGHLLTGWAMIFLPRQLATKAVGATSPLSTTWFVTQTNSTTCTSSCRRSDPNAFTAGFLLWGTVTSRKWPQPSVDVNNVLHIDSYFSNGAFIQYCKLNHYPTRYQLKTYRSSPLTVSLSRDFLLGLYSWSWRDWCCRWIAMGMLITDRIVTCPCSHEHALKVLVVSRGIWVLGWGPRLYIGENTFDGSVHPNAKASWSSAKQHTAGTFTVPRQLG